MSNFGKYSIVPGFSIEDYRTYCDGVTEVRPSGMFSEAKR